MSADNLSHPTPQQEEHERRVQTEMILDLYDKLREHDPNGSHEDVIDFMEQVYDRNDIARALNQREEE